MTNTTTPQKKQWQKPKWGEDFRFQTSESDQTFAGARFSLLQNLVLTLGRRFKQQSADLRQQKKSKDRNLKSIRWPNS